ncbi:50S ribosomal protein L4 [Candidatus Saccharibacteria bacterium]|nr:50S ribosomal protein L4 [Candidatus Saccharibacteria bacterium]
MATLDKTIFNVEVGNHELLKVAYNAYLADGRMANAKTLKRGEVRGGGKKPWRQKGTGRARFGSSRNPIWRGGGIAFGPTGDQNYTLKLSKTAKRVAVKQALSLKNAAKSVVTAPVFAPKEGKTKEAITFIENATKAEGSVLLVVTEKTDEILRATNNLPYLKVVRPTYLNVFDILNADVVVITEPSLPMIAEWLNSVERGGENG